MIKQIALLGSTGSIGVQSLEIVEDHPDKFRIEVLTAFTNADLLIQQAKKFRPNAVVIVNHKKYKTVADALSKYPIKVYAGEEAITQVVEIKSIDIVINALVGFSGLLPTLKAIETKKTIALANKETLVVAGDIITQKAKENNVQILPIDSEHSAIFQCLTGETYNDIEKIYLTCSGGPFYKKKIDELQQTTVEEALKHPIWNMGKKITIDSATLMNKGLEVIEAKWLFALQPKQIKVIIHPQCVIHSLVEFEDGALKAQLGTPSMKIPIGYALNYPQRLHNTMKKFTFADYNELNFIEPDIKKFRNLHLAYKVMDIGGNAPCSLNAANEIAVAYFLKEKINFLQIPDIIENTINKTKFIDKPNINDYIETDKEAREIAKSIIEI